MAAHAITLAWRILWTEKPGRLQSIGSQSQTRLKQLNTTEATSRGQEEKGTTEDEKAGWHRRLDGHESE